MADSKMIWAATLAADGGAFYRAPLGTVIPSDPVAALAAAYKDQGFVGDDGFKISPKRDVKQHKAFGGETVKVTQDSFEVQVKVTLYETNINTLKTVFGDDNVTATDVGGHVKYTVKWNRLQLPRSVFVIRFIDGNKTGLHVIEEGQVVELDDVEYVHDSLVRYSITINAYAPSNGNPPVYTLIDDPDDLSLES
jgi:hypothetical protein